MQTALRAGALLTITGAVAGLVLIFATDPAEAPAELAQESMALSLTSSAFEHEGTIPSRFTCDGENVSPALAIAGVPEGTQSLALIMDDPDAMKPAGKVWDHWVVFNIPPSTVEIPAGKEPEGVHGINSSGKTAYGGPCPPDAEHRYFFRLLALDAMLDVSQGATKQEVLAAAQGHIVEETTLMGRYAR